MILVNSYSISSLGLKTNRGFYVATMSGLAEPDMEKEILYTLSSDKEETVTIRIRNNTFAKYFSLSLDKEKINLQANQDYQFNGYLKFPSVMDNEMEEIPKDPDKFYISFLEIDGPLGTHISS